MTDRESGQSTGNGTLKRYFVVSPEYETRGCGWYDPPEWGCDVVEVETDSKRTALLLGVREMLKDRRSWASTNRLDHLPPWTGYRVEEVPDAD